MKKYIALVFLLGGFAALVAVADFYHNAKIKESKEAAPKTSFVTEEDSREPETKSFTQPKAAAIQSTPITQQPPATPAPVPAPSLPETFGILKLNLCNFLKAGSTQKTGPTSIYSFSGQRRADGTACGMVITVMDLSKLSTDSTAPVLSLDQFLKVMLNGHRHKATSIQESEIKDQKINNLDFKKISWQTNANSHGIIYVTKNGNYYVALTVSDSSPYNQQSLPRCEKIIHSFTFNNAFKQAANKQ